MELTADPEVMIESRDGDSITYLRSDGVRWRVTGTCDRRGDCLIGAIINGETIRDKEQLASLGPRPDSFLDVPLGPGYDSNCCPMKVETL